MKKSSSIRLAKLVIVVVVGTLLLAMAILSTGCSEKNPNILKLKGDIQNNIVSSISTVTGKIVVMNKNLGEKVKKGDIIAVIDDKNQAFIVEQLEATVRLKAAQLELTKEGATTQAITMARADLSIATSQLNQGKSMLENYKLTSLADGVIVSKNYQIGDVVVASSNIADIAIDNDLYIIAYIPDEYLDRIKYNQKLNVNTSIGVMHGEVIYIALNNQYTPKDKQSTNDSNHKATKIKVKISSLKGVLRSGMTAEIEVPLK